LPRPPGAGGRNALRVPTRDPAGRSLFDPAGRRSAVRWPQTVTLAAAVAIAAAGPAAAERLITSLSNRHGMVRSNYTAAELGLVGWVGGDAGKGGRRNPYDIVATIMGPRETLRVRRKQRVLGIWVNTAGRTFVDPPSYLAVLASRPLDLIAGAESRRKLQLGI